MRATGTRAWHRPVGHLAHVGSFILDCSARFVHTISDPRFGVIFWPPGRGAVTLVLGSPGDPRFGAAVATSFGPNGRKKKKSASQRMGRRPQFGGHNLTPEMGSASLSSGVKKRTQNRGQKEGQFDVGRGGTSGVEARGGLQTRATGRDQFWGHIVTPFLGSWARHKHLVTVRR